MLSENLDKKIKESLEQRTPAFDENSWQKMEKLLDKHLPQKKDNRRRWIILIFFFLLLGGGAAFLLTGKISSEAIRVISNQPVHNDITVKEEIASDSKDKPETKPDPIYKKEDNIFKTKNGAESGTTTILPDKKYSAKQSFKSITPVEKIYFSKKKIATQQQINNPEKNIYGNGNTANKNKKTGIQPEKGLAITILQQQENLKQEVKATEKETGSTEIKPVPEKEKITEPILADSKKATSGIKKSILKNFAVLFFAGPDISAVGISNMGKLKLVYGAGIGYKISNRFSVRSGFYVGKKVYSANPEDYNPPASFWAYYPNLKRIDADCKIYEIPVSLDYHFGISKKQSWFVSAGVSGLFMKKEVYNYYFKPAYSPQYIYNSRSYNNKNKFYFPILNLSGGYAKKISPLFTIQAAPYFKIAMTGVGYGKVRLNSSGILFTVSIPPFHTTTNKKNR